jgi:hypothetical protein
MVATSFDTEAFDRATDGILQFFSREQAEALVAYRGDSKLRRKIDRLARKSNEGQLSEREHAEYQAYVQASKFVATLQAKARKLLEP